MNKHLQSIMDEVLAGISTERAVAKCLPEKPSGRCIVIGAGKASAAMAAAVEKSWQDVDVSGVVSTRHGFSVPTERITIIEAGHPIPDEESLRAACEIDRVLTGLSDDDLVLALISGGGSATLEEPAFGLTLEQLQAITNQLMRCGASIGEINTVRQSLSTIKGGQLAARTIPAKLVTLVISDIPGDDLSLVASGPTIPSPGPRLLASEILARYQIDIPVDLDAGLKFETSSIPDNPRSEIRRVACNHDALDIARSVAEKMGYRTMCLGDDIENDSAEFGKLNADLVKAIKLKGEPCNPPVAIISGGETTVTLGDARRDQKGGRNQEFMLSLLHHLNTDTDEVLAIAIDTDGIDGVGDAAGAFITPESTRLANNAGLSTSEYLANHSSYDFFEKIKGLIRIGPTQTNVNDLRVVLIG